MYCPRKVYHRNDCYDYIVLLLPLPLLLLLLLLDQIWYDSLLCDLDLHPEFLIVHDLRQMRVHCITDEVLESDSCHGKAATHTTD